MNQELTPSEIAALAELINDENEDLWLDDLSTQSESDGETFYGSNYPTAESSEAKNRAFMAIALEGMSKEDREIVLRTAMSTDIKGDDPLFILLIALGKIELLLHQKPVEISAQFDRQYEEWRKDWQKRLKYSNALFTEQSKVLRNHINDTKEAMELTSQAALEAHGDTIAEAVDSLVKRAAFTKVSHDATALTKAAFYIFLSILLGVGFGFLIPQFWQAELDPIGARQLTLEQAKALEWAMSDIGSSARNNPELVEWATGSQGQYAKELMDWNQVLLTKQGGKLLCEKDAQKLGVVLKLEGREAKRGFCTLWVRSPRQRKYVE